MSTLQSDNLTPERQQVLDAHRAGLTPRQIAAALDVSTQRIYQQLDRLRDDGFIPQKERAS